MSVPRLLLMLLSFCLSFTVFSNDACEDAQFVNCGEIIMDSTADATMDTAPYCGTLISAPGKWYQFEGTGDEVQVKTCLSMYDTRLSIYEGNCEYLICVDGNDDDCGLQSRLNFNSEAGTTYYIIVNGSNGASGDFRLEIICVEKGCTDEMACNYNPAATVDDDTCHERDCAGNCNGEETGPTLAGAPCDDGNPLTANSRYNENCLCQPEGITCDYPLVINSLPFTISGNTKNYENDYEENICESSYLKGNDFVMEFTPEITGFYNLTAADVSSNAGLLVFEGCPNETEAICVDRSTSVAETESLYGLMLTENTTYYIVIATNTNVVNSNFNFSLERRIISGCTDAIACNYDELAEIDNGSCFNCADNACPGDICDDGDPNTGKSVYDSNCNCIVPKPGTNCAFPVYIDSIPFSFSGNTSDYKNEFFDNPCGYYFLVEDEFVMEFTPSISGDYNLVSMDGIGYTWLLVFQGCPNQADALCIENSSNNLNLLSLTADLTYYIVIAAFEGFSSSDFNFYIERNIIHGCTDETSCNYNPLAEVDDESCFSCNDYCPGDPCDDGKPDTELSLYNEHCECVMPPLGISCNRPFVIDALPFNATQSAANGFVDYNVNPCGDKYLEGSEFVFEFKPEVTDEYIINSIDFTGSLWFSIYDACPDEENAHCVARPSEVNNLFELSSDTTYYLVFSSSAKSTSTLFNLSIERNVFFGCQDPTACNYDEDAEEDNGSCLNCGDFCPGDPCDDGDPTTQNTEYDLNCACVPVVRLIDHRGNDFWLMFNSNFGLEYEHNKFYVFITGSQRSTGTVEIPGFNFSEPFSVRPGSVTKIQLPDSIEMKPATGKANKGVHITATKEIVVYGLNQQTATTDAFTNIPTDALGTTYMISSYNDGLLGVVATENNTNVSVTLPGNQPSSIQLNKGEVYQYYGDKDITGTLIEANKPVGAFGGNDCTYIPIGVQACDHIIEQFAPIDAWGKQFYAISLATRKKGDLFRMLAAYNNTTVHINDVEVATLQQGEFFEEILPSDSYYDIRADQPIQLTQYSLGSDYDGVQSDPFMMMIPPYEQYSGSTTFTTPATNIPVNYVNIVSPHGGVGKIEIDGITIPAALYEQIGNSNFYGLRMRISVGAHNINGDNIPFGAFIYGFGNYDSYGYPAGAIFSPVLSVTSIQLNPPSATLSANKEHCVQAALFNQFGEPVNSVRVDFEISNTHNESGFSFSDENGLATFCYTGSLAGEDQINATVSDVNAMASVNWTAPIVFGCTEILACNYNPIATDDDGSCIQSGCVLPVTLLAFAGEALPEGNLLKWTTVSELDNDYFTILSSTDGIQFSAIANLNGSGTTSEPHTYQFADRTASEGLSYYQLQQTDFNGTQHFSEIIMVERGEVQFNLLEVYPIPTADFLQFTFGAPLHQLMTIELLDATGKTTYQEQRQGSGIIETLQLDLSAFSAGIYFVQLQCGEMNALKKIIVQ